MWRRRRSDPVMMEHHRLTLRHAYLSHTKPLYGCYTIPCNACRLHPRSYYTIPCLSFAYKTPPYNAMPAFRIQDHCMVTISCHTMKCLSFENRAIPCHTMHSHAIPRQGPRLTSNIKWVGEPDYPSPTQTHHTHPARDVQ